MSKRNKRRPPRIITASGGPSLVMAAPSEPLVDFDRRTISGVVVPFGRAGATSGGRLRFSAGSLTVSSPRRVKLLREHVQADSVGYATSYEELSADEIDRRLAEAGQEPLGVDGIWGTHHVPEGENGDRALAEAANGIRDAFSVGVALDDATLLKLRRSQAGAVVDARGQLREVSLVSVPAFDDARVGAVAAADLVVSSWTTAPTTPTAAGAGLITATGGTMFTEAQRRRLAQLLATASLTDAEAGELAQLSQLATAAGVTVTINNATITGELETPPGEGDPSGAPAADASATASAGTAQASGPAVVPAVAGAARVTGEASVYSFSDGQLVRDLVSSGTRNDAEAAERVARFNAQLRDSNPASVVALAEAAATTTDVDGDGTDLPTAWGGGTQYRPDLMRQLVDAKRPFISRLTRLPITNATPFAIPTVGEFEGVGDHTEGTPHRPAGSFTLGAGDVVQPKATSGAWEVSRELLDAANPALDRIAARAMLRDYARQTEGKWSTLFAALAATGDAVHVYNVATLIQLRAALLNFVNDDEEAADILGLSKGLLGTYLTELDATDRAQIPFVQPSNAVGTMQAGYTGFSIDGTPAFRAARLDTALGADYGVMARSEGLLWAESNVLQFRFDEVLGPGVIKLALWAYSGAAITDTDDVKLLKAGADPTP